MSHWKYKNEPDIKSNFGFVYLITNKKTSKAYVGCKQYFHYTKKRKGQKGSNKRETNWRIYMGSSKELLQDIEKIGKRNFKFEMTLECTNEPAYYNNYVGGKFYRPVQEFTNEPKRFR